MRDVALEVQLKNFTQALSKRVSYPLSTPASWIDALAMLDKRYADILRTRSDTLKTGHGNPKVSPTHLCHEAGSGGGTVHRGIGGESGS
jgi:hypothetical protein